jgi:DNA-directed RNA polymerase specialized sigma subunit
MSKRRTRPEDIRNPERYFKRFMAIEYRKEKKAANRYQAMFDSLDELAEAELEGRRSVGDLLSVDDSIYTDLMIKKCDTVTDWITQIEDNRLREAMQKLSRYQRNLIFLRFCKEKKLSEIAALYDNTPQAVAHGLRTSIKKLKTICEEV